MSRDTDNRDVPDKPIYEDVEWLADVQRELRHDLEAFSARYGSHNTPRGPLVSLENGRLKVRPR